MRIATQFRITLIVFSLTLIVIASSIAFTSQQVSKSRIQESLANNLVQGANDLSYLSNDYVIYRGNQQLSQWQIRYSSFSKDVGDLDVNTTEQQLLVQEIEVNQQRMKTVFDSIVSSIESKNQTSTQNDTLSSLQVSWSRMSIQSQTLITDASQLAHLLRDQVDQLNMVNFALIFAIIGAFSAFLAAIYVQTFRRTLKSMSDLQAGAHIIGSGNLDFRFKEDKKDEIADVSKTFNQMTINLKNVTASKNDLEKEIIERKKAEDAIKRQASLIDLSPDAIIIRSLDGAISFWSKGAEKLYGWTKEEAIGRSTHVLLNSKFVQPLEEILDRVNIDGKWSGEIVHTSKDGERVVVQSHWLGRFDNDGKICELMESNVDITDRVRMQTKLEDYAIQLEEYANQMEELASKRAAELKDAERLAAIGATAGMVGHDIRNPLQAITSDIYLAKTDLLALPESEEKRNVQESLEEIGKNVSYINKIVQDLQDYARPLTPMLEEIDLERTIHWILAQISIPENITVKHFIRDDFPKIRSDKSYIQRILTNLANNAIQAMPSGGKLTIGAAQKGEKSVITVEDNGEGIPENVRNRLFTPLVTSKSKGQGFGLAVVKRFTEGLGGSVSFESEVGKGTKFIIELPLNETNKKA